ncbi:MAG: IS256 family transposase [Alphaproteobacteria bacterium]|nr:IS256 family transposase [Alphaproteobacteria bacterium]
MNDDNVIELRKPPESAEDALVCVLRRGAQELLARAVEEEAKVFLDSYAELLGEKGLRQVVRNGYLPTRNIQTGIGSISVKVPRLRDRSGSGIQYASNLVPRYLRKTKNLEELLPVLYLKGISTGDFEGALTSIVGPGAVGFSSTTIARLKQVWLGDYEAWRQQDLSKKRYIYFWADGIYFQARMAERQCILVIVGADEFGNKEVVAVTDGFRECEQSWREVLLDLKNRGLAVGPKLAVGDGALGFWKALHKVYSETKQQRCWVHKTANILSKLPKTKQAKAKEHIHDIWLNETKEEAEKSFDVFVETYTLKYPKAAECLAKDRSSLLAFYDFPAEHWRHIRTTNPIESTFATVRLRTDKTRGCLSRKTTFTMVFKLLESAQKKWKRLGGPNRVAEVIKGVDFVNGIAQPIKDKRIAA